MGFIALSLASIPWLLNPVSLVILTQVVWSAGCCASRAPSSRPCTQSRASRWRRTPLRRGPSGSFSGLARLCWLVPRCGRHGVGGVRAAWQSFTLGPYRRKVRAWLSPATAQPMSRASNRDVHPFSQFLQVHWTRQVTEAIQSAGAKGLAAYAAKCTQVRAGMCTATTPWREVSLVPVKHLAPRTVAAAHNNQPHLQNHRDGILTCPQIHSGSQQDCIPGAWHPHLTGAGHVRRTGRHRRARTVRVDGREWRGKKYSQRTNEEWRVLRIWAACLSELEVLYREVRPATPTKPASTAAHTGRPRAHPCSDVVSFMAEEGVEDLHDFKWESQLRWGRIIAGGWDAVDTGSGAVASLGPRMHRWVGGHQHPPMSLPPP